MKDALHYITDVFTGADGGINFIMVKTFLEEMEERSKKGNSAATEILEIVYRFERLLKYTSEFNKNIL